MTNCDPNWQLGYVGTRTQWNVTPDFYMGFDINLHQALHRFRLARRLPLSG